MVAVQFSCPHCSGLFQVDSSMSGQQVACPHCQALVAVPAMQAPGPPGPLPSQPGPIAPPGQPSSPLPPAPSGPQPDPAGGFPGAPVTPASTAPVLPPGVGPSTTRPTTVVGTPQAQNARTTPAPAQRTAGQSRPMRPVPVDSQAAPTPSSKPLTVPTGPAAAPGGASRLPTSAPRPIPTGANRGAESLLPPGISGQPGTSGKPAGPEKSSTPIPQPAAKSSESRISVPTEDGGYVTLRDPVKTVGRGDDAIELRTLSPEERARRKLKRNLVLWGFGLLIISITLVLLLVMGPV
jgi:hypothetical protein